ncbi:hypothetical protein [Rhodococcus sp. NPDC049939]|uniref:hypothetical protein n=1 Tax=Rhodococcus sp. NPDC049939 TaxID=3155511 RepID=UPI0033F6FCB6
MSDDATTTTRLSVAEVAESVKATTDEVIRAAGLEQAELSDAARQVGLDPIEELLRVAVIEVEHLEPLFKRIVYQRKREAYQEWRVRDARRRRTEERARREKVERVQQATVRKIESLRRADSVVRHDGGRVIVISDGIEHLLEHEEVKRVHEAPAQEVEPLLESLLESVRRADAMVGYQDGRVTVTLDGIEHRLDQADASDLNRQAWEARRSHVQGHRRNTGRADGHVRATEDGSLIVTLDGVAHRIDRDDEQNFRKRLLNLTNCIDQTRAVCSPAKSCARCKQAEK